MIDWKKRAPRALPFVNPGAARGILPLGRMRAVAGALGGPGPLPVPSAAAGGPPGREAGSGASDGWGSREIRTMRLLATVHAPAQARQRVDRALMEWGYDARRRGDVVLVVSELVSDAVRYPLAGHIDVRLDWHRGAVELTVSDACPAAPLCTEQGSGGGMLARVVLDECSARWTWSVSPLGRTVSASFAC